MHRVRGFAAAAVLAIALTGCDELESVIGSIEGQVAIEGTGVDGVTVTLSNGAATSTAGGGRFSFADLPADIYTVAISGFPSDAVFSATSMPVVILVDGRTTSINFHGTYIRTSSIRGRVSAEGLGLAGVTVSLSGPSNSAALTALNGEYSLTNLRAGSYTVEISGFNARSISFSATTKPVSVDINESRVVSFDGAFLRTAQITGRVSISDTGLEGVTVNLTGPANATGTATTDAAGNYTFTQLRAGDYRIAISGYDAQRYRFTTTSETVALDGGETANIPFDGVFLHTAGIGGRVTADGEGLDGVRVALSGAAADTTYTADGGLYAFSELEAGNYSVAISGYPVDAVFDGTLVTGLIVTDGQTATADFEGAYLKNSSIQGRVAADGEGLGGVAVVATGPTSVAATTKPDGNYTLGNLRAGSYTVEITSFDATNVSFSSTTQSVDVAVHESKVVSFDGTYLRSAGITGQVTVAGNGLERVTVNLTGPPGENDTTSTDAAGHYAFTELRAGEYTVEISGFDSVRYEFATTTSTVALSGADTATVVFDGTLLLTSGISGRVTADGVGLDSITVVLSGTARDTTTTANGGRYLFGELGEGDYVVTISGYDTDAYTFDRPASPTITVARGEAKVADFEGAHTLAASISGYLYVDENPKNDSYDEGQEDLLAYEDFPLVLQGPGTTDSRSAVTDSAGRYIFGALKKGTYRVVPDLTPAAVAALDGEGYAYGGPPTGTPVVLSGASAGEIHIPVDITRQTMTVKAVLGLGDKVGPVVEGVEVDLYATLADADVETDPLASAVTDSTGTAAFTFPRAEEDDRRVFSRVSALPHESLEVTANGRMELTYRQRYRSAAAPNSITLVNRRADLRFSAATIATARGGGAPLADWDAVYTTGDDAATADLGVMDADGELAFHVLPEVADLPVTYTVRLADDQTGALGEQFEQRPLPGEGADSGAVALTYTHDGLSLPGDTLDLGRVEVKFTTQSLVVGVHWERDHRDGYTTEGVYGDKRPSGSRDDIDITLLVRDEQGHVGPYRDDDPAHDINVNGYRRHPGKDGLVVFRNLPAELEFMVDADIGADRILATRSLVDTFRDLQGFDVGAFGTQSGGTPEVRICPHSTLYGRAHCSTFAYLWANSEVWGWVGSADYGGAPTPNDTIADRFGVSAPDVFANGLTVSLSSKGFLRDYHRTTTVGARISEGEFLVGDGEFRFTGLPTGYYNLSVTGDDEWGSAEGMSFVLLQTEDLEETEDGAGSGALHALSITVPYLKTSISGTVANDVDGDGQADPLETASGIELELLRVQGSDTVATGRSDTTTVLGAFSFDPIVEGAYVVQASSDDYFAAGTNTIPIDHSPVLTTDARPGKRTIASGDALPVWNYDTELIDADAGQSGAQSDAANFNDADFIVLLGSGTMTGRVTRPDDGNTTDTDTDPDPFSGLTVNVQHCEAAVDGIRCQPGRFGRWISATTRRDGSWEASGLTEGYHLVTVSFDTDSWEYGALPGTTDPRRGYFEQLDRTDATRDSLDFHLVPPQVRTDGALSGRVTREDDGSTTDTDGDPDPLPGRPVHVDYCEVPADANSCQPGRYGQRVSLETRADGSWEADGLREGYYQITVDLPDTDWNYGAPPGSTVPVSKYFERLEGAAAARDSLDFHLVPPQVVRTDGALYGRVTREDDGAATDTDSDPDPFAGLSVHMDYCEAPADANSCEPGRYGERKSVETGNDGNWEADQLQTGYHLVTVDLPDAEWEYGAPPGSTEPVRKYFVEVESQSSAVAADGANASSLAAEDDSLDFHLVQRATPTDPVYGVLVLFYNSTRGPIWEVQTNWLTDKPYGEWHGVTTDSDGNVVELVLEGNGLGGYPTPLLDSLVHLKRLDLNSNFFDGIPATYANFDSLTYLNLSNTWFRGDIPAWIGDLTSLDTLELDFNRLTGLIPTEFGNLTELDYLDLSSNRLTGSIPDELGNLTDLGRLYLDENELSGTIPDTLGTLSSLEVLNLGENKLTGGIPAALGDLASLKALDLGTNELAGAIPSDLTGLDSLTALDLSENKLTSIPSGMDGMSALRWLWLNDNEFTGAIPSGIVDLPALSGADLSDNGFTGSIPAFDGLDILRLANNSLTGTIPTALGDVSSLYDLQLQGNSLTGTIPTELGQLERLQVLRLDTNSLTGNIPTGIGSITTLTDLYVNGNSGMSGTLPRALTNLRRLDWFFTHGTSLCAPTDATFQTWLKTVNLRRVSNCTP